MKVEEFYGGDWIRRSRCWNEPVDPDMFFDRNRVAEAEEFCLECPVAAACKMYGNRYDIQGVCGARSHRARKYEMTYQNKRLSELAKRMQALLLGTDSPSAS
jgi:hypothetical protein